MKRCFITLLGAIALMVGLFGVSPSLANAAEGTEGVVSQDTTWSPGASKAPASSDSDTPVVTETNYDEDCVTEENKTTCTSGSASASSTAQSSSIADIRIKGRIAGEFFVKGGLTKKQVAGKRCRWISGGYNSARRADGSPFSYRDVRKQYVCKTNKGPTGFQVKKCGNPYAPQGWQPTFVVVRNPVVVRSLNSYKLTGKARVKSVSKAHSVSETTATCVGSDGYGYGEATGTAKAFARIRFTFRHRSSFRGELRNAIIRHNESINVTGFAKVATSTSTKAKTEASCSNQEEVSPPTFAQFRQVNDVYVNATTDHCVTVDFPEGHSGSVFWTANKGSFAVPQQSAQDMVQVCSTYKAPSEVPASGTDTITVTATDSVTGKSVTKTTDPFVIKAMPPTP